MSNGGKLLDELQEILDSNGDIPPKTSNRLILAAVRQSHFEIKELRKDVNKLQIKSSIWGGIAGLTTTVGTILVALLLKLI